MMAEEGKTGGSRATSRGSSEKLWTPANVVTLVRICLVPVFVVALVTPWPAYFGLDISFEVKAWVAAGIFIVLAATDGLDGYLARSRGEVTDFGKFMDPLADKILVAAALLSLIELGILPSWPALIILAREFIVSGIRMVAASKGTVIAASWYGKVKTVLQIIAIVMLIVKDTVVQVDALSALSDPFYLLSWLVMLAALALTIVSMLDYFVKARHLLGFGPANGEGASDGGAEGDGAPAAAADGASTPLFPDEALLRRAEKAVAAAREAGVTFGTAESLTGGLIAATLTAVPGSSEAVRGGIVSYVDEVKRDELRVPAEILASEGAVSRETACAMARGACERLGCDIAVSVTGIAGPGGAEPGKPVGTVWMGVCCSDGSPSAQQFRFDGDREAVRRSTVEAALGALESAVASLRR